MLFEQLKQRCSYRLHTVLRVVRHPASRLVAELFSMLSLSHFGYSTDCVVELIACGVLLFVWLCISLLTHLEHSFLRLLCTFYKIPVLIWPT